MNFPKNIFYLLFILLFCSCSQKLDFNQLDDYFNKPVFTSSLAFFSINNNNFIETPGTPAVTEIEELTEFRIFENTFFKDNLTQLKFNFELINEFNRDFKIEISLLNNNNLLIYKLEDLDIAANNRNFKQEEVLDVLQNPNVINFTKVLIVISLDDSTTPIDPLDVGVLDFKSSVTVFLETNL